MSTNRIYIGDTPLWRLIQEVYNMSVPVGMGKLHYVPGDMPDTVAQRAEAQLKRPKWYDQPVLSLDYVMGRQCKMWVWEEEVGKRYILDTWFDHTQEQLDELLRRLGIHKNAEA